MAAASSIAESIWDPRPAARVAPPQIPGYQIIKQLGRGGMGVVFKARHNYTGRLTAIKLFQVAPELPEEEMRSRFRRETRAIARLGHPNIVGVYDAGEVGDRQYLVMEYLEGVDLQGLLASQGQLPIAQACQYVRQAALGLQHAFEQGLVHRDVKPANIMITRPPAGASDAIAPDCVKLLDLGLAKIFAPDGHNSSPSLLTREGTIMGTPDYIAPEQVVNSSAVDIRADIYSLGCTFYQLLTGQVPFPTDNVLDKLDRHRFSRPRQPELIRRDIGHQLADILRQMMAKNPSERYQTPAELVAALDGWLARDQEPQPGLEPALNTLNLSAGTPEEQLDRMRLVLADLLDRNSYQDAGELVKLMLARNGKDSLALAVKSFLSEQQEAQLPVGLVRVLEAHQQGVAALACLPDGNGLISAGGDKLLHVWDLEHGARLRTLTDHRDVVKCVAVSPDGSRAVSGGKDGRLLLWDVPSGRRLRAFHRFACPVQSVSWGLDQRSFLSATEDGHLRLWNADTGERVRRLLGHTADVKCVVLAADGRRALSGSWDRTMRHWIVDSGREASRLDGQSCFFDSVALSADGRLALGAGSDPFIHVWDLETGSSARRFEGHSKWITSVALSPDGSRALSGSQDMTVRLWDLAQNKELHCFAGHTDSVTCVAFTPDGKHAVSGSADGTIRYWRLPRA